MASRSSNEYSDEEWHALNRRLTNTAAWCIRHPGQWQEYPKRFRSVSDVQWEQNRLDCGLIEAMRLDDLKYRLRLERLEPDGYVAWVMRERGAERIEHRGTRK